MLHTMHFLHKPEVVRAKHPFIRQIFRRKRFLKITTLVPEPVELEQLPSVLPEGLAGVGRGLGRDGVPLLTVMPLMGKAERNIFPALVPHGGTQRRTDVAFCFMPGVEHQSRLMPVALAPQLKIAI
jgi:hypothetical protein